MPSSGMLRRVALVRTDISEESSASIIRVTRISELGTTFLDEIYRIFRIRRVGVGEILRCSRELTSLLQVILRECWTT
jgi:hypothetical protein